MAAPFPRILAILTLGANGLLASAADWPNLHGPNRDGHSAETGFSADWGKSPPEIAWSLDVGHGWAGVAVADGKAFLFHRIEAKEILRAFDQATCKEIWNYAAPTRYRDEFDFDDGPRCVPVVACGRVFALGANGDLHAVEAATGKKLWHRNLVEDYKPKKGYFGVGSSPILVADKLLVNVGGKGAGIVAFDPATGKELWKGTNDAASYSTPVPFDLGGKTRVAFLTRAGLVVLDPTDGSVKFTRDFRSRLDASVNAASPVIRDGQIFLSSSYGVGGLLLKPTADGWDDVWANDTSLTCHYNTPVRVGKHLYGIHGRQEGGAAELRCVEWDTGTVKWTEKNFGCASLIAVDGRLIAVRETGEIVHFLDDPSKFASAGKFAALPGTVRAAPALSDGRLYVRDEKKLVCVKLR